jgi:nicotinamidase-related amidase
MTIKTRHHFWLSLVFFIVLIAASGMASPARLSGQTLENRPALIVVDIQNFYFPGGSLPLQGSEAAGLNAKRVLELFRMKTWPVIHVRHLSKGAAESELTSNPQWDFQINVAPLPGEHVVTKREVNAFRGTNLLDLLKDLKVKNLVIIGMQTHMCLEGAVRAAADYGFAVTVAEDACAARDLEYNGKKIPADAVHLSTLATLKGAYAKVLTAEELLKELNPAGSPAMSK